MFLRKLLGVSQLAQRTIQTLCDQLVFSNGHGYCATAIPEVMLFRAEHHEAACPLLYERGLVFIFQGFKLGVVAGQEFRTGAWQTGVCSRTERRLRECQLIQSRV